MRINDIVYVALFAAITAALGLAPPITLPIVPVPITAQSLGVMLAGSILGARRGGLALLLFIALVAAGLPVLSGGRGGLGVLLFSPSAGFLLAFPIAAFIVGWLTELSWSRLNVARAFVFNVVGGIGVVYALGIPGLAIMGDLSLVQAASASAVFIPGDIIKAALAAMAAVFVRRGYPLIAASRS
ncbi:MAG: biotin transporter BioY [Dichotomicrobium sp.]